MTVQWYNYNTLWISGIRLLDGRVSLSAQAWHHAAHTSQAMKKLEGTLVLMKAFICRGCLNSLTSTGRTIVDIDASTHLELVDKFCYLGDMLSVDGDTDAAVEAIIRIGWNKFRSWCHCLQIRIYHLIMIGRLYSSCVWSSMLHVSETRHVRKDEWLGEEEMHVVWSGGCQNTWYSQYLNWAGTHQNTIPALFAKAECYTGTVDSRGGMLG